MVVADSREAPQLSPLLSLLGRFWFSLAKSPCFPFALLVEPLDSGASWGSQLRRVLPSRCRTDSSVAGEPFPPRLRSHPKAPPTHPKPHQQHPTPLLIKSPPKPPHHHQPPSNKTTTHPPLPHPPPLHIITELGDGFLTTYIRLQSGLSSSAAPAWLLRRGWYTSLVTHNAVQQHCQLASYRNDRPFLDVLAAAPSQL